MPVSPSRLRMMGGSTAAPAGAAAETPAEAEPAEAGGASGVRNTTAQEQQLLAEWLALADAQGESERLGSTEGTVARRGRAG